MLSKRTRELLDLIVPGKRALPAVGKGEKLTQGADGTWRLEPDTVAFIKSLTAPTSDLVKSISGGRRVTAVLKRAPQIPLTEAELQGGTPTVGAKPRTEDGLSDQDLRILEQEITSGNPAIMPAQASKLFMQSYQVIAANGGRRLTTESASYGVPAVPNNYRN